MTDARTIPTPTTTTPLTLASVINELVGLLAPDQGEMLTDEGRRLFGLACRAQSLVAPQGDLREAVARIIQGSAIKTSYGGIVDRFRGNNIEWDSFAFADSILALLTPARSGWRPIESAPRDGTKVDLWSKGDRLADCKWGMETPNGFGDALGGPGWVQIDCDVSGSWFWCLIGQEPTHFQPLPEAPSVGVEP